MRKRKERQSETLIYSKEDESGDQRSEDSEADGDKSSGFFACYLLTSLCPRYKGHTYIGFTVNPRRRIRQHNGELCSGASRTKKKRPWEMVLCIYGFPTNVTALQFEWAWQHPVESLAVRKAAIGFKSLGGLANKIKLAYTMLTLPVWNNLNLNVNFFSTKYTKHYAGCPTLPSHMKVYIRSMDELPCYTEGCKQDEDDMFGFENGLSDDDEEPGKSFEDATIPVLYSTNHHNNEEEAFFVSENYEQPQVDDKEPERTQVSDSADHLNNEEEAYCVSDDENYEQPSYINKGMWDYDNDDKEHKTIPVSISANHHNNGKEAYCVSDDENYEQPPSCANKDMWDDDDDKEHETIPVSVSADHQNNGKEAICVSDDEDCDIPKRSYTEPDCSHVVSPTKLNENDGSEKKISGSSGEIEVVDLFTPSPEYRTRKKRGGSVVCPEIIDLTESPICV